jgi:hypothetical protein
MNNGKIETFTDLNIWREGHKLVIMIYRITKGFPREEMYALVDQMRRATASITANIAEGFGRHGYKEDVGYLKEKDLDELVAQANLVDKLLQGFIKKNKTFINP